MVKYIRKINPFEIFCIHCHGKELLYSDNYVETNTTTWYVKKDGTRSKGGRKTGQTRSSTSYWLRNIYWKCNSCSSEMVTFYAAIKGQVDKSSAKSYKQNKISFAAGSPIKFSVFKSMSPYDCYHYSSSSGKIISPNDKFPGRGFFWYLSFLIFIWFYIDIALVVLL